MDPAHPARLAITGDALPLWVGHAHAHVGAARILQAFDMPRVTFRHRDRQRIACVVDRFDKPGILLLQINDGSLAVGEDIRLQDDAQIAHHQRADFDLPGVNARRQRPNEHPLIRRMALLERFHQIMHHHELVAGKEYGELRVDDLATPNCAL